MNRANAHLFLEPLNADEIEEAANLWLDGFDTRDIADELKRRECVIWKAMDTIRAAVVQRRAA